MSAADEKKVQSSGHRDQMGSHSPGKVSGQREIVNTEMNGQRVVCSLSQQGQPKARKNSGALLLTQHSIGHYSAGSIRILAY